MSFKTCKTCLLYNFPQHYRLGIFGLIGKSCNTHFYFGDKMEDVKRFDTNQLAGEVFSLKNFTLWRPIYLQLGTLPVFYKKYSSYIVLGEYYNLTTWILLLFLRFKKKRRIFLWTHGWYGNETRLKKVIKKAYFSLSDGLLLYGDRAKELMISNGFTPTKLHVIYNSLNYSLSVQIRSSIKQKKIPLKIFDNNYPTLFFIGRLTKNKKLFMILNASEKLNELAINHNILIIGGGEEEALLKDYAKTKNLKNIYFYGPCYDEFTIANLIYNSDLCVSPGNVGLTAIHSMSYGTPVLTHNNFSKQMPEYEAINPTLGTGDFFEEGELDSMVNKIIYLLEESIIRREEIRESCFRVIDQKYNPHFQLEVLKSANVL